MGRGLFVTLSKGFSKGDAPLECSGLAGTMAGSRRGKALAESGSRGDVRGAARLLDLGGSPGGKDSPLGMT